MNKKQYNNVIDWTLKHEAQAQSEDSLEATRAICTELGVALPNGTMEEVADILATNDYMYWHSCTMQEAQEAADNGTPAIGISDQRIVLLAANDEEQPVGETASVMTLDENTSAYAVDGLRYYVYGGGSTETTSTTPHSSMTPMEYYNNIMATPLQERSSNGMTYCNLWAQAVLKKCGISYPTGGCTSMLNQFTAGFSNWQPLNNSEYKEAQERANNGYATVAITPDHIAVVTPNNIDSAGSTPANIGQVLVSQSGWDSFYCKTLSWAWAAAARGNIQFFYYNG